MTRKKDQKPNCIIAARLGSKRIKEKNIKLFRGLPFIAYSIRTAKKSKLFENIYVSTDSEKIAKVARKYGAIVPNLRPKKLSGDNTSIRDVVLDFISKNSLTGPKYNFFIYPIAPLMSHKDLITAYNKIKSINYDLLISVKEFEKSPERAFIIKDKKNLVFLKNNKLYKRSQDLKKQYFDSGSFFIFNTKKYVKNKYYPKKTTFYLYRYHEAIDVDKPEDLDILKILYKKNSH